MSIADNLSDLAVVGAEAVRQAFRLGVTVAQVSQNLFAADTSSPADSWAYVLAEVSAATVQEELDAVQKERVRYDRV